LKLHGVTLPSGSSGASPTTSTTLNTKSASVQKALAACASLRPKGFGAGAGGFSSAAFAAYRNCLKLHGVTLPSSSGADNSTTSTTPNTKSASVQKALAACASLLPKSIPTSSTTSTSTTS
jgi:hypothetical protein